MIDSASSELARSSSPGASVQATVAAANKLATAMVRNDARRMIRLLARKRGSGG